MIVTNDSLLQAKFELSLFLLRLGVFIVMIAWPLDNFIKPGLAAEVYGRFSFISGLGNTTIMIISAIEITIILAFMLGLWKRFTYGFVMLVHAVTLVTTWEKYTSEIGATYSLLYFAAWPMLAACISLYVLRDLDVKFTVGR
ncbi:MAG: putative oxidoreductase [Gammaproteobacteria bacterium]|jgi:putative oxidoreductase